MQDNNPTRTHRKFASDCIESHMNSVLKVSGIRYIWFGIHVRRFRSFVLALQCLLLAIRIVRLCKSIVSMLLLSSRWHHHRTHPWARDAYQLVAGPRPHSRVWAPVRCRHRHDCWLDALAALAVYPLRWTSVPCEACA